jgi:hypothetical protein
VVWVIGERTRPDELPNPHHVPLVRTSCPNVRERSFRGSGTSAEPHDITVLVCELATRREYAPAVQQAR